MKILLTMILMMIATQVFAESAAEASMRTLAERERICAKGTDGCYEAMQTHNAASKRLDKEIFIDQPERNRQRQQEVIQDEQLRQQVRRRGY